MSGAKPAWEIGDEFEEIIILDPGLKYQAFLNGDKPKKIIVVPQRIVNLVV